MLHQQMARLHFWRLRRSIQRRKRALEIIEIERARDPVIERRANFHWMCSIGQEAMARKAYGVAR